MFSILERIDIVDATMSYLKNMVIILGDIYFRRAVSIMPSWIKLDFSGVICVDGGQVISPPPSMASATIESILSNCFLAMNKRSRLEKIKMLLIEGVMKKSRPVCAFSSSIIQIINLLGIGKSYEFISSVFSLSFTSICHARNKIIHQGGFKNMNVFRVVMVRLNTGLQGNSFHLRYVLQCQLSIRGELYA